jgi:hypothetical protein
MGEIDHAQDTKNECEARCHQKQQGADDEAGAALGHDARHRPQAFKQRSEFHQSAL